MLLFAPLPVPALQALLRLVRLHDCEAQTVGPYLWLIEGMEERVESLVADALQDTRIKVATATAEA